MHPVTHHLYRHWTIYLGLFLSALCLFTALRIEWFNAQPYTTKLPVPPDSGKWRYFGSPSGLKEMMERKYRTDHNLPKDASFTPQQTAEIETRFQKNLKLQELDDDFLVFVSSFGLLQYLITPILFALGLKLQSSNKPDTQFGIAFTIIASLCGLLMLYRGYFTSLGW
ncbi:MAG TPA: hypothetical protein VGH19_23785 [Verrucomicrobiae bacterium]